MDCLGQQNQYDIHGEIFSGGTAMYEGFDHSPWKSKKGSGVFHNVGEMCAYISDAKQGRFGINSLRPYVCEIKAYHFTGNLFQFELPEALAALKDAFANSRFLFLGRQNHLRRIVSMLRAKSDGIWHSRGTDLNVTGSVKKGEAIALDLADFRDTSLSARGDINRVLKNSEEQTAFYSRSIAQFGGMVLYYEEQLKEDPNIGAAELSAWLGYPYRDVKPTFVRTNDAPIRELVMDYESLERTVQRGPFSDLLL